MINKTHERVSSTTSETRLLRQAQTVTQKSKNLITMTTAPFMVPPTNGGSAIKINMAIIFAHKEAKQVPDQLIRARPVEAISVTTPVDTLLLTFKFIRMIDLLAMTDSQMTDHFVIDLIKIQTPHSHPRDTRRKVTIRINKIITIRTKTKIITVVRF